MPNPILNDKNFEEARAGWAAPTAPSAGGAVWGPPGSTGTRPVDDGPVSPWRPGMMTVRGSITATAVLFVLLLASATVGWLNTSAATTDPVTGELQISFPGLAMVGVIVTLHQVDYALRYCRRVVALKAGQVVNAGWYSGAIGAVSRPRSARVPHPLRFPTNVLVGDGAK